jgi:hypothetical protein
MIFGWCRETKEEVRKRNQTVLVSSDGPVRSVG